MVTLLAVGPLVLLLLLIDVVVLLSRRRRRSGVIEFDLPALRKRLRDGWHGGRV